LLLIIKCLLTNGIQSLFSLPSQLPGLRDLQGGLFPLFRIGKIFGEPGLNAVQVDILF